MQAGRWLPLVASLAAFGIAVACTWTVLRATRRWRLLDWPNERSAHRGPMPTAGGLGIIAGFWGGLGLLLAGDSEGSSLCRESLRAWAMGTAGLLGMACDDLLRPLKVGEKLVLLCLAAGIWVAWEGPIERLTMPVIGPVELGVWGWGLAVVWILALCNAYNFMDGIDGIVGVQTASVAVFLALSLWRLGGCWTEALLLSAATAGFLVFNLPPARLFMGDVGAAFCGFMLAGLSLLGERAGLPLWVFAAFTGYFLFDTGYTLVRRGLRRENLWRAHRKHLYQRLHRLGWTPVQIDLWVLLVNIFLGIGGYVYQFSSRSWGGLALAIGAGLLVAQVCWIERRDGGFV